MQKIILVTTPTGGLSENIELFIEAAESGFGRLIERFQEKFPNTNT